MPAVPAVEAELGGETSGTPLELFFDLVFVFAITQVTGMISDDPTWGGVGRGMLVLAVLSGRVPLAFIGRIEGVSPSRWEKPGIVPAFSHLDRRRCLEVHGPLPRCGCRRLRYAGAGTARAPSAARHGWEDLHFGAV